ncbi:hypothetical protein GX441_07320 [bacterium]|nr:hypothetical protein [bacterium]
MKRLLVLLVLSFSAPAIILGWMKTYGGSNFDYSYGVQRTSNNGYIIAGYTESFGPKGFNLWIIVTNSKGDTISTKIYGDAYIDMKYSLQSTLDGNFIISAEKWNDSNPLNTDLWVLKLKPNGDTLWTRSFDYGESEWGNWISQTSDGGYIVAGNDDAFSSLIKLDANGDSVWPYDYFKIQELFLCVQETNDGNYIVCGFSAGWGTNTSQDLRLTKISSQGEVIWDKKYGLTDFDRGDCVRQTSDGGYILTGLSTTLGGLWLLKTNAQGDTSWTKVFKDGRGYCVQQTKDGGYIITGEVWTLIKTDPLGNVTWTKKYIDVGRYVEETPDGGFIVVGANNYYNHNMDICLIKTDANGDTLSAVSELPVTPFPDFELLSPIGPRIVLRFAEAKEPRVLSVFDASGRKVDEVVAPQAGGVVNWGECYGPGVYFMRVESKGNRPHKVVLIR